MMGEAPPYVMLMASLPALGPLLSEKAPPINESRLERRLRELSPRITRSWSACARSPPGCGSTWPRTRPPSSPGPAR